MASNKLAKNSVALIILQLINMIAPLIVLPYLSRIAGVDGFGLILLAFSACLIGTIITDFGFNLSATYKVSKQRNNVDFVNEFIGAVLLIKICLFAFLFIPIIFYHHLVGFGEISDLLIYFVGLSILAQTLIPTWFFQGIEKIKNITIYLVLAKSIYVLLVFSFIKSSSDIELVILLYALSNVIAASIAVLGIYMSGYSIKLPRTINVVEVIRDSSQFFLSRVAVLIYTSASTFLVGSFGGLQQAAMFGVSEKLYNASQSITSPVAQALFPHMAAEKNSKLLFKVVTFVGGPLLLGCSVFSFWAEDLLSLIFGDEFRDAGNILRVFLLTTLINFVAVIFGYPAFACINKVNVANNTVLIGAFVHLIFLLCLFITDSFSAFNVAISILITETIVMLSRVLLFNIYNKSLRNIL